MLVLFIQTPFDIVFICFSLFFADKQCGLDGSKLFFSLRLSLSNEVVAYRKAREKTSSHSIKSSHNCSNTIQSTYQKHSFRTREEKLSGRVVKALTAPWPIHRANLTNTLKRIYMEKKFSTSVFRDGDEEQFKVDVYYTIPGLFFGVKRGNERKKHKVDLTRKKRTTMAK